MGFEATKNNQSCFSNSSGLRDQTLLNQIFMPFSFIHPFSCTWTITSLGIFCFGNVLIKMIIGSGFVPAAQQARTTVTCFFMSTSFESHGLCPFVHSSVGWHIKCKWDLIHAGDLGQLKVVSLLKTDNIKMKYQNLILTGCWKFLGKFHSCPHVQTSLHKVKAPFRGPWEIINVFFSCRKHHQCCFHHWWNDEIINDDVLSSSHISCLRQRSQFNASPESRPSSPAPPLVILEVSLTLPSVLASEKALLHVASTIWWHSLGEEVQSISPQALLHAF